jgi:hypothetical protein
MNELLARITLTVRVIKESFADYRAITLDLHNINHGISNHMFRTFKKQYTAMMFNFFKNTVQETVQGRTYTRTKGCGSSTGSRSHDGQKDVHGGHHCPKGRKSKISSGCKQNQRGGHPR